MKNAGSTSNDNEQFDSVNLPKDADLFRGLPPNEVDLILSASRRRRVPAKSTITYQGDPAKTFHLLWRGRARAFFETSDGRKLIQLWITPGHILGGGALVSRPSVYLVSTEAVRDSLVLIWDRETIRSLARRFPALLDNALFIAAHYISWYVITLATLSCKNAREKLAHVLLGYVSSIGKGIADGIELDVTNEEVASSANITPYTTSRILSEWQKAGLIRKHRGRIVVRSPEELFMQGSLETGTSFDAGVDFDSKYQAKTLSVR
jgi:CRP-like cAMP-binding protein